MAIPLEATTGPFAETAVVSLLFLSFREALID